MTKVAGALPVAVNGDRRVFYQYLAVLYVNIISLAQGTTFGWLSPYLPLLISITESPLDAPVTDIQATWIASLLCVGAIFGTVLFGWSADRFGRKVSLCGTALPLIGFWSCVAFGRSVEILYLARVLAGLGAAGVFLLVPLYVTEIAEDRIRGTLGSFFILFINTGTLVCFIAGTYLSYHTTSYIFIFVPIVFLICFTRLPETPQYLVHRNNHPAAENALKILRGYTASPEHVDLMKKDMAQLIAQAANRGDSSGLTRSDFGPFYVKKALMIGLVLVTLNQLSGCFALIQYAAQVFADAGSEMDSKISSIIVGIIQLAGSYTSTLVMDRWRRKTLYIVTALGSCLGLTMMGVYAYLSVAKVDVSQLYWLPVASLSFVIFIASVGMLPLTFVILSEILPDKLRSFGGSLCTTFMWVVSFVIVKYFAAAIEVLGMHGSMWFFAGCCLFGAVFNGLFVPETRGKSLDEIKLTMGCDSTDM
ncbi:facilitated trehalose transporter Tret1-like [Culex pipiens pallens]|uniref:facilitated trehalose transporter Tret1-like n=1 Tax=Culex pipiens pallens TaxID=42434 RepID=UPI0019545246|nr:facilitated trehalose transporter Tret1-like [Culex pipiens pallens]